jgi:hypothetical protein
MILRPQALLFAFVTLGAISVTAQQGTLFRPTEPMHAARYGHRATLLSDGRVLVTGGGQNAGDTSAEVYDPTSNIWTSLMSTMSAARQFHTATALPNGRVLVPADSIHLRLPAPPSRQRSFSIPRQGCSRPCRR